MFRRALPVLAATLLVACGGGADPEATPATDAPAPAAVTSDAASAPTNGSTDVPAALQFTAPLISGGEIELGELAGRPVLLWFWAPW